MTDSHSAPTSPDDEPETPFWLPPLGFALFIIGGLAWAVTPPAESPIAPEPAAVSAAAEMPSATAMPRAAPSPPAPPAMVAVPTATVPAHPAPNAAGSAHDAGARLAKPSPTKLIKTMP